MNPFFTILARKDQVITININHIVCIKPDGEYYFKLIMLADIVIDIDTQTKEEILQLIKPMALPSE